MTAAFGGRVVFPSLLVGELITYSKATTHCACAAHLLWTRNYWQHITDKGAAAQRRWLQSGVLQRHPYDEELRWDDVRELPLRHPLLGFLFPALWRAVRAAALSGIEGAEETARLIHANATKGPAHEVQSPTPRPSPPAVAPWAAEAEAPPAAAAAAAAGSGAGALPEPPPSEEEPPPPPPPLHLHPDFVPGPPPIEARPELLATRGGRCACQ